MIEVLPSCHFSAKHHRLDCLYFLIVYVSKDASEERKHNIIGSFLTEIILALKEGQKAHINSEEMLKKTRRSVLHKLDFTSQ
ncbi:hypothetical protein GIB67_039916 [Kingdonia uniflora]|uniref:Uncharacterized protein n=1 Tax=Kingdonia uniflora TaxID=39325 RepID=A0A7J7P3F8_9MAGN|nr:hypothetical protein GIB67_039916 [Kingdonia uniflora]